jgi:release factor glutamine methyltransferase
MGAAAALPNVGGELARAVARLMAAGVPEPRADAEVLLAHALGTSRGSVITASRDLLSAGDAETFEVLLARRAAREPVQYIVGEWEFWSLPLAVDPRVLIPRSETELVVKTVLRVACGKSRIVDVGTGSGAIALALARELPRAPVCATDVDPAALVVARANLARHAPSVRLVCGDLLTAFRPRSVDVVASNPPYVADGEHADLLPEVRDHEPARALLAGADGLAVLRRLVAGAPEVLVPGGWLIAEMGAGQADAVRSAVVRDGRYEDVETVEDHAGIARVLMARRGGDQ